MRQGVRTQADCNNAFHSLMGGGKRQENRNTNRPMQNENALPNEIWQLQAKIDELNQQESYIKEEKKKLKQHLGDLIKSMDGKNND